MEAPEAVAERQRAAAEAAAAEDVAAVHEDNEWHIEVRPLGLIIQPKKQQSA